MIAWLVASGWAAEGADAGANRLKMNGQATVVSVDGPAQLTLRAKGGRFKVRLALIDAPAPGECGAQEATAALTRLAMRRKGAVRYVNFGKPDADGRYPSFVGPRRADLLERSLARDLVETEWARPAEVVTVSEADHAYFAVAGERSGPRAAAGVWSSCGGRLHLPATEAVPSHAPASWNVTPDGITESVGPFALSPVLSPSTVLTVPALRSNAVVETTYKGDGVCWARIPSLELVAFSSTSAKKPSCDTGDVYAISTSGPGSATTTGGLHVGSKASEARDLFPRLKATDADATIDGRVPLSGYGGEPWAWQTLAGVSDRGTVTAFLTSTVPWPG